MPINPTQPTPAHSALMMDLHGVLARYQSMPVIERVAVISQLIGQEVLQAPREYTSTDIMAAIAQNIAAGNANAGSALAGAVAAPDTKPS